MYVIQQMHENDSERTWIAVTEEAAKNKAWAHFNHEYMPDEFVEEVLGGTTREAFDRKWQEKLDDQWSNEIHLVDEEGHGMVVYVDVEMLE